MLAVVVISEDYNDERNCCCCIVIYYKRLRYLSVRQIQAGMDSLLSKFKAPKSNKSGQHAGGHKRSWVVVFGCETKMGQKLVERLAYKGLNILAACRTKTAVAPLRLYSYDGNIHAFHCDDNTAEGLRDLQSVVDTKCKGEHYTIYINPYLI